MTQPRYNIYTAIHKALRAEFGRQLTELGCVDETDVVEVTRVLDQVDDLLTLCSDHLQHENEFIHTALQRCTPHRHLTTVDDHQHHEHEIGRLRADVLATRRAVGDQRVAGLLQLYRNLALFVADNLQHMALEETHNSQLLWEHFTDQEILAIEHALVESIEPVKRARITLLILSSVSHTERMAMLTGMAEQMPPDMLEGLLEALCESLGSRYVERVRAGLQQVAAAVA